MHFASPLYEEARLLHESMEQFVPSINTPTSQKNKSNEVETHTPAVTIDDRATKLLGRMTAKVQVSADGITGLTGKAKEIRFKRDEIERVNVSTNSRSSRLVIIVWKTNKSVWMIEVNESGKFEYDHMLEERVPKPGIKP